MAYQEYLKLPSINFDDFAFTSLRTRLPQSSSKPLIITGAILVPIAILGILPYTRKPPPKPQRDPPPLPEGVERVITPEGLELLVAKPKEANLDTTKAPIFLQHGGFGTALATYERWRPYFVSQGRVVFALSVGGSSLHALPS